MAMPTRCGRGVGGALGNMKNMDPRKLAQLLAMLKARGGAPGGGAGRMPGGKGMPMPPSGGGAPMPTRR